MKLQLRADLMLLMITFFWGGSILLTKIGLDYLQEYNLISLRFTLAFLLSGIVFYKHLIKTDFKTVKYAFILSFILFIVYVLLGGSSIPFLLRAEIARPKKGCSKV
jgi:drug/metabolite transporter (DMT)-like permease